MRVYHRLIHIRDQKERHDDIPRHILDNPVFTLITKFRQHVQEKSAPITKASQLSVGDDGMVIFAQLAQVLQEQNNVVMVYLVACVLERLFGKGTIQDDLEMIRGNLSISDIIDGVSLPHEPVQEELEELIDETSADEGSHLFVEQRERGELPPSIALDPTPPQIASIFVGSTPSPFGLTAKRDRDSAPPNNAFSALVSTPSPFAASSGFGGTSSMSVFGGGQHSSAFGEPISRPIPPLSGNPSEHMLQPQRSDGFASLQIPSSLFLSSSTTQLAPPATKPEPSFVLSPPKVAPEPPQPRQPPQEAASLPPKVPLNPSAPAFSPPKPSPPVPSIPPSLLPKTTQPAPPYTFDIPKIPPLSAPQPAGSSFLTHTPEDPQTTSAIRLIERRQTLWDFPGTSGPRRPPRINTDLASDGSISSPKAPPLLKRVDPISLPPTTPHTPLLTHPSFKGNKSLKGFPSVQNIQTPADILSPLNLTPSINAQEFSFAMPVTQQIDLSATTARLDGIAAREEAKAEEGMTDKEKGSQWIIDSKEKAARFKSRGVLVKNCFSRWKQRFMEQMEYLEALRTDNERSNKLTNRELSASISVSSCSGGDRKRRISGMSLDSAQRKRARKRLSAKYAPPRTDDDLVRRLREVRQLKHVQIATSQLTPTYHRTTKRTSEGGLQGHSQGPYVSDLKESASPQTGLSGCQSIRTTMVRPSGSNESSAFRLLGLGYPIRSFELAPPLRPLTPEMEPPA